MLYENLDEAKKTGDVSDETAVPGWSTFIRSMSFHCGNCMPVITKSNPWIFVLFIMLLFIVLVSMSIFRSPAVALMPDATIKPLRSKANAIINLMGTFGAMLVLVLGCIRDGQKKML